MHRLAAVPRGSEQGDAGAYVEHPPAPVLLLTSADTDLVSVEGVLAEAPDLLGAELRGLNLAALAHPAVIDHYLATTVEPARLVVVRLLGGRGHWSYGLDRLGEWVRARPAARQLLVLAGTEEEEEALASCGTVDTGLSRALAQALREGGPANVRTVLGAWGALLRGHDQPGRCNVRRQCCCCDAAAGGSGWRCGRCGWCP